MEKAGLGRRLAAIFIDWAAALFTTALFAPLTHFEAQFLPLIIFFFEVAILTTLTGSSLGQRLCGVRVLDVDGSTLTVGRVVLRTLLICLVLPAVFMKEGKGYHDHFANSQVIKAKRK